MKLVIFNLLVLFFLQSCANIHVRYSEKERDAKLNYVFSRFDNYEKKKSRGEKVKPTDLIQLYGWKAVNIKYSEIHNFLKKKYPIVIEADDYRHSFRYNRYTYENYSFYLGTGVRLSVIHKHDNRHSQLSYVKMYTSSQPGQSMFATKIKEEQKVAIKEDIQDWREIRYEHYLEREKERGEIEAKREARYRDEERNRQQLGMQLAQSSFKMGRDAQSYMSKVDSKTASVFNKAAASKNIKSFKADHYSGSTASSSSRSKSMPKKAAAITNKNESSLEKITCYYIGPRGARIRELFYHDASQTKDPYEKIERDARMGASLPGFIYGPGDSVVGYAEYINENDARAQYIILPVRKITVQLTKGQSICKDKDKLIGATPTEAAEGLYGGGKNGFSKIYTQSLLPKYYK